MKGTKEFSTNKGITLIALVITIIVMLILVGVTISMAVNGGLFDYAGKASGQTKNALNVEGQLANGGIEVDGQWYNSIDEYLIASGNKETPEEIHSWTRSEDTFTCSTCNASYTMGQVVDYAENSETNSVTSTAATNGNSEQTISVVDTTWVVLGIENTDGDEAGVNETLLITTQAPVSGLVLYGAEAYNNGPDEIDRICRLLYSNSEFGEARGMTIEDVNAALNYTPQGGEYYDADYNIQTPGNFTTKLKDLSIFYSLTDDVTPGETLGEYELNGYSYSISGLNLKDGSDETVGTITQIEKDVIFGTNYRYWLASRGVSAEENMFAYFGVGSVKGSAASSYNGMTYLSNGQGEQYVNLGLRPVVLLTSKLPE